MEKPTVKIGVILPLSGDNDHLGQPIRELIQYKVDHFPKDSRFNYKVIFEDDQLIPRQTLLAAHRLVDLENVDVLVTFFTGPGSVVAPYAAQKHKVHLMYNFKEEMADARYNFIHVTPMLPIAQYWTHHAEALGYKKIALMVHRNAGGEMALKALEEVKTHSKLEWVDVTRFNQGEKDFRITLLKIKEKKPDVLLGLT
jgi:ABC-type branched-subunit amino acid transport system substrate-binding protein